MIVLFNPWSTPSPKKPLPMSLLSIGAMLEGEFDYCIVDGNLEADPVGKILAIAETSRCGHVGLCDEPVDVLDRQIPRQYLPRARWTQVFRRIRPQPPVDLEESIEPSIARHRPRHGAPRRSRAG